MLKLSLNTLIALGALTGVILGLALQELSTTSTITQNALFLFNLVGGLFIDLLKMILVPLVFTSIAVGVANLRGHQQMHQVWQATLAFFVFSMALAIIVGFGATQWFEPGKELKIELFQQAMQQYHSTQITPGEFTQSLLHSLFVNPFEALAKGNVLAIVIFALFIGLAIVSGGERYRHSIGLLEELLALMLQMIQWVMRLAPLGIMALLAKLVATQDASLLLVLLKFIAVIIGATLLHGAVLLPLILYGVTGITPLAFWRGAQEALITAFATSSSSATLPITLRCAEQELGVKPDIAGFVIPLGATINMDGTALYEASAALFIANLCGIEVTLLQQLIIFFTAMLAAIGAPGIPSAGMVTMVMVLQSVGLPAEAIAILLPIDRLLDTVRTAVNVEGDMIGSLVVQKLVTQRH